VDPKRLQRGDQQAGKAQPQDKHRHRKNEASVVPFPGNDMSCEDYEISSDMSAEET
jgi:hypothetical protein